jgi:hypothetical protein
MKLHHTGLLNILMEPDTLVSLFENCERAEMRVGLICFQFPRTERVSEKILTVSTQHIPKYWIKIESLTLLQFMICSKLYLMSAWAEFTTLSYAVSLHNNVNARHAHCRF